MLTIRLEKILKQDKKYWVFLDSENKYSFENIRYASDFLRKVSKKLTETLFFINEQYCQAEMIYRQYYFVLEDFQLRCSIESSLDFIKDKIALLLLHTAGENRNTLVTRGIENMLFELKSVYETLMKITNISRSDTAIRHQISTKSRIVDLFLIDFKRFENEISVSRSEIVINHDVKLRKVI
jgi:hypothetical protein